MARNLNAYLADTIQSARIELKLSRPNLAERAGTTTPTITAWEEGRGSRLEHLVAILTELGLELRVVRAGFQKDFEPTPRVTSATSGH